jgi:uncharacterized protein (UPF0335 family)
MEVRTSEEIRAGIEDFSIEFVSLLLKKKEIDGEIKELKESFKEIGVDTGLVSKIINKVKREMKKTDSAKFEEEKIKEWVESSPRLKEIVNLLLAK